MPWFSSSLLSPHIFSILLITHFFTSCVCSFGNFILASVKTRAVFSKLVEELNNGAKSQSVLAETFEKFRQRFLQNECLRTTSQRWSVSALALETPLEGRQIAPFSTMGRPGAALVSIKPLHVE